MHWYKPIRCPACIGGTHVAAGISRCWVVFLLNVTSVDEARSAGKLPLGQAKLMQFELIPLGPLNPLRLLLPPEQK